MRIIRRRSTPPSKYPGLAPVAAAIERTVDAQERRVASLDQRSGVLLGFAGILVGVILRGPSDLNWLSLLAAVVAALAAGIAGFSLCRR